MTGSVGCVGGAGFPALARAACRVAALTIAAQAFAGGARVFAQPPIDLARASLEELMNIEITSVSRHEQRAVDVAAAVYVITADEIRRSGATLLPELFRGVPGMSVARINANEWAISARGFNDLWSNKLLVLIDGRSVYSRTLPGVDWSSLDLPLDDIQRIEVIRGPGGSIWGANAVNGVINIITKPAAETQGVAVSLDAGTIEHGQAGIRYGGVSGHTAYRVYSRWSDRGALQTDSGDPAGDSWQRFSAGLRLDWAKGADAITSDASVVAGSQWPLWASFTGPAPTLSLAPATAADSIVTPTATFGWTHTLSSATSFGTKAFVDYRRRRVGNGTSQDEVFGELEGQLNTTIGERHAIVVGGGYRRSQIDVIGSMGYSFVPSDITFNTASAFAQDDIALGHGVRVSFGSRFEYDDHATNAFEPSGRVMWNLTPQHRLWAAITQGDRTPSASDLFMRYNFAALPGPGGLPILVGYVGNPDFHNEAVTNVEGGYRFDLHSTASIDVNVYRAAYDHLSTAEPMAPAPELTPPPAHLFAAYQLRNLQRATTTGLELAAHWVATKSWRLDASYTGIQLTSEVDPASRDATAASFDGNAPAHQWQVRSSTAIGRRVDVDASVFHASRLDQMGVPAYTRVDARLAFAVSPRLTIAATAENLFDAAHQEFAENPYILRSTQIPRSLHVHVDWRLK